MTGHSTKKLNMAECSTFRGSTLSPPPNTAWAPADHLSPDTADATYTADHAGQLSWDLGLRILFLVIASTLRLRRLGPPSEMMKS